jgi:predicted component of type VI protein secretion system
MMMLRLFKASDPGAEIDRRVLTEGELTLGRDPASGWVIEDPSATLSRRHCTLVLGPAGLTLRDDSTNGVALVGGERLPSGKPVAVSAGTTLLLGAFLLRADAAEATAPTVPPAPVDPALAGRLLEAFCAGARIDASVFVGEDPAEVMRRAGSVYRQMVFGLGELMNDRTRAKAELHLERTSVQAADNNPFRWAPPARVAVDLLKPGQDGFLASEAAVESSFRDLRGHLAGLVAASRAAVEAVLGRLSPEAIGQMLKGKSFLANRSGALWAEYVQAHEEASEALAENSEGPAAKAFRAGYEGASA